MTAKHDDPSTGGSGRDTRDTLEQVLREIEDREKRRTERQERSSQASLPILVLALSAVSLYLWVAEPAWLQAAPFPEPDPAHMEAGLRMDIFTVALRVEDFRTERGRLPTDLSEALESPGEVGGIQYRRLSPSLFQLEGEREGIRIFYQSDSSLRELVGDARERLAQPPGGDA